MKTGLKLIKRERKHNAQKFTTKHDDAHMCGDLAVVAAALAVYGTDAHVLDALNRVDAKTRFDKWGLTRKYAKNRVKMLAVAGGLIAAEIDRFLRCEQRSKRGHKQKATRDL